MRILLLGGIAEAKQLATALAAAHEVIYSIAGRVRQPRLACEVRSGGFSSPNQTSVAGLMAFCRARQIDLVIDATHPYAATISATAVAVCGYRGIACWRYTRPAWAATDYAATDYAATDYAATDYATWHDYHDWSDLLPRLQPFKRPLFTIGASVMQFIEQRAPHQHWFVRTACRLPPHPGVTQINQIGPFGIAAERALMQANAVDALISKNSGGRADKLRAAEALGLPLFVQTRPRLPAATRCFASPAALLKAIKSF